MKTITLNDNEIKIILDALGSSQGRDDVAELIEKISGANIEYTLSEAAEYLGLSGGAVIRMAIRAGHIRPEGLRKVGKIYLVRADEIERYKAEYSGKTGFAAKSHAGKQRKNKEAGENE